jgi:glutathione S-transferase
MVLELYIDAAPIAHGGAGIVALVLAEKNIPFELVPVDMDNKKEHKSPEFLAMQPFGQVPVLVRSFSPLLKSVLR